MSLCNAESLAPGLLCCPHRCMIRGDHPKHRCAFCGFGWPVAEPVVSEALYVLGPDRKPVPDPQLLGPLLFAALRALSREQGQPVTRAWREEARHTLLYVSQNCSSLRTSLEREDFTGIQLGVELQDLINQLTGLRDAICPAAREPVVHLMITAPDEPGSDDIFSRCCGLNWRSLIVTGSVTADRARVTCRGRTPR